MGWSITTNNNKYQIKYGSNTNYSIIDDDKSYFTITDTKNIGINNENPDSKYLLDINGETRINSNVYIVGNLNVSTTSYTCNLVTSNVIGYGTINSNSFAINYTSATNYSNNTMKIYGQTSNFGEVYINENLNVKNNIRSYNVYGMQIYGKGSNITDIDATKISFGTLNTKYGGTGLNVISRFQILFGGINNSITNTDNLRYEDNTLYAPTIIGSFDASRVNRGRLFVEYGGTGLTSYIQGAIPFGKAPTGDNITASEMSTSTLLSYNDTSNTLNVDTLSVQNIKIQNWTANSILVNNGGVVAPLNFRDVGLEDATYTTKGIFKPFQSDFEITDGVLKIKSSENNIWIKNVQGTDIIYPSASIIETNQNTLIKNRVGINKIVPQHILDVVGDINTSNGTFRINGEHIINVMTSNFNSNAIPLRTEIIAYFNASINEGNQTNIRTYAGAIDETWKVNTGATKKVTFEVENLKAADTVFVNKLNVNYNERVSDIPIDDNLKSTLLIKDFAIAKLKFTKYGRLVIGPNVGDINPSQVLEIYGNIHASGYIRSSFSDNRLKTLTSNIINPLDIIDSMKGFYYVPNEHAIKLGFEYDNEIGLSAQDVQKVVPEIVKLAPFDTIRKNGNIASKSGEEYLTICYERLSAVFVEAIKELRIENKELKNQITLLKNDLDDIKKIIYIN